METAIKIAIENSWMPCKDRGLSPDYAEISYVEDNQVGFTLSGGDEELDTSVSFTEICLDPLFWKALTFGLKLDIDMEYYHCPKDKDSGDYIIDGYCKQCGTKLEPFIKTTKNWLTKWHSFIDHLAEGKDIDSFFSNLIK